MPSAPPAPVRFFFDYVDPLCYVVELRLAEAEAGTGRRAVRHPLELVVPPAPLIDPASDAWRARWQAARDAAPEETADWVRPSLVPWTRKAHELVLHAREEGDAGPLHRDLLEAFHREGRDLGRVDVLVELATARGFDRTTTKAVLDVDRHLDALRELRSDAERRDVHGVPTLLIGARRVEGLPTVTELVDALGAPPSNPT